MPELGRKAFLRLWAKVAPPSKPVPASKFRSIRTRPSLTMDPSKPVDRAFTIALPKVELHAHLNGSISRQCLHQLWRRKKAKEPSSFIEDPLVLMPPGKVDYTLQTFFQTFGKIIYQLCDNLESLAYATKCVLDDFLNDGVRYLELRTIPREFPSTGSTQADYISTVLDVLTEFRVRNQEMSVYLIVALDRGHTTAAEAMKLVDLAIANRSCGVVGVDLCGNPTKGDVTVYRDAFAHAKANNLGLTLHFAETPVSDTPSELAELLDFWPDRLGHVIHVPENIKDEISRRKLGLELCMSCNVHAKLIEGDFVDHHFGLWRHSECPIALCTDDVGFFCSPVSNEYLLAAQHFDIDRAGLVKICQKSVDAIFGGEGEKERLRRLILEFAKVNSLAPVVHE